MKAASQWFVMLLSLFELYAIDTLRGFPPESSVVMNPVIAVEFVTPAVGAFQGYAHIIPCPVRGITAKITLHTGHTLLDGGRNFTAAAYLCQFIICQCIIFVFKHFAYPPKKNFCNSGVYHLTSFYTQAQEYCYRHSGVATGKG